MVPDDEAAPARPFTVLAVCTGNICRSPAVERLLAAELGVDHGAAAHAGSQVVVASAGVGALVGRPMPAQMAVLVREAGANPDDFVARQLTPALVADADLVLALTTAHRSQVVRLHPAAVRRTFTLRELARLAADVDPAVLPAGSTADRLRALLPLAAAQRGGSPVRPGEDDVVDPYRGPDALYARAFDELRPAVTAIARAVG